MRFLPASFSPSNRRSARWTSLLWALAIPLSWTAAACEGSLGSENGDGDGDSSPNGDGDDSWIDSASCQESEVGEQPLRRLSSIQYRNTLRALFGEQLGQLITAESIFPETQIEQGFHADAEANTVNTAESNAIEDNAERIAELIIADPDTFLPELLPCDLSSPASDSDIDGCIDQFVDDFGSRAYRRPITSEEAAIARRVYDEVGTEQGSLAAFAAVIQLLVQSPGLLYRVERGDGETEEGYVRLSSYEMATRLSYFLTDSMPDEELMQAAAADELRTPEQIRTQADRLAETGAFEETLRRFIGDWLHLYELEHLPKDPSVFPDFDEATRIALQQETGRLLESVMNEGDGSLRSLLSTATFPVHATTASLYGVDPPPDGEWAQVEVPHRHGLLSQASVMSVLAETDRTSPIHRGAVFVRDVLCVDLPALPGDIDITGPLEDTSGLPTARERLAPLLESSSCRNCHQAFNPIGLAFENYDAVGAWRETENDAAIDASGSYSLDDGDQEFDGPVELLALLSESDRLRDCFSLQAFRAMKGRREFTEDECSIESARSRSENSGGDLRETLLSLVETRAFLYRREVSE